MFVNLEVADRDLMIRLVQSRLSELPGELRRTEAQDYHDELKREQEALVGLLHRLQASDWDVNA